MIAPDNFGEVSGIWISASGFLASGFNPASGFLVSISVFWYQFFHQPDEILRSDRSDPSDRKKNPVADFQQQV